ncbi:MAG: DUF748 domain-containing protein [Candidatus Binataceae bacterium]
MGDPENVYLQRALTIARHAIEMAQTRRARRIGAVIFALILIYGIAGYFVVPHILRGILTGQVSATLHRPVTVGRINFNPYRLRLQIDSLHVGDHSAAGAFADVGHLDVKASWTSAFRFAPIVTELTVARPAVHLVRDTNGTFNFSDLLTGGAAAAPAAPAKPASPLPKFAVSNIQIIDGDVTFDDQMLGAHHAIEKLQLDVPFIANLPADTDIIVQPLLEMRVDGAPVRIAGVSKPFAGKLDSIVNLRLHRFDLPHYAVYLPKTFAIKLPSGALSMDVLLHFKQAETGPHIVLNGAVALDQLDVRDLADAPLVALDHGEVKLTDVEPLAGVAYLREIAIDGLKANVVRNHDGTLNLTELVTGHPTPAQPPGNQAVAAIAAPPPAATPAPAVTASPKFDASVDSIAMLGSSVNFTDLSGASPAAITLERIHVAVNNLRLNGQIPATFEVGANIHSGGAIAVKGSLDLPKSDLGADVTLDQVDLPALQAFAQSALAGTIASGKFTAHATLKTHFAGDQFNVHAEPADVALDNLAINAPRGRDQPIAWTHFGVSVGNFDLAARQVDVKEIRADGMKLFVQRYRNGTLSLKSLMRQAPPPTPAERALARAERQRARKRRTQPAASSTPAQPPWQYQVESVAIEKTDARLEDHATPQVVKVELSPLNIHLQRVSSDFSKPITLELDGARNRAGTFKIEGTAAIDPLKADLHVDMQRFDLAEAEAYASTKLNAQITSAALTMKGDLGLAEVHKQFQVNYRGDAELGNVTTIDKLTGDDFLKWKSLSITKIDAAIGNGPPKVHVGVIALSDFYTRLILNSAGKLNIRDITSNPEEQPKSLTRAEGEPGAAPVTPAAAATPAPGLQPGSDLLVGKIKLQGGKVDYTDNFIKPNYSANLTDMAGSIGTFGTTTTAPAEVALQGHINGSAPLNIDGSVNPLAPTAFVDLKAKATGIELTGLSPYSTKYTGYPIVKGTLNVDVHYMLNQGALTATNHIFIDQFTFGDRVENSTATNLPVRLAVALLKNSRGEIDVTIPVSGSLSDPQFSVGALIWHAFLNLIVKAVTSPFSLLASAVSGGGSAAGGQDLSYVAFDPGLATLTPEAQQGLATVATALQDRPALKISICGRVDPKIDLQGLREAWLADQIRAQKVKDLGDAAASGNVPVTPADYDKYLSQAYSKAKIPKPRYFIGLAKSLPPDEMKKLMITNAPVTDGDLKKLADERANAVRKYLSAKIDPARLSVLPLKLNADGIKDGKTTRADLSLQ